MQIGTATADSNGNYVVNLNLAQTNGEIISVVASDAAGNQSSPALVNAADITPPAAPATWWWRKTGPASAEPPSQTARLSLKRRTVRSSARPPPARTAPSPSRFRQPRPTAKPLK
ncbi:Ig-like domain-containing protein [Enterobacter hormaechei]